MDIDEALIKIVGEYGPAQRRYFLVLVWATVVSAMQTLHMVFIGAEPKDFLCSHGPRQSPGCPKPGETCAQYHFPRGEFTSIVSEVDHPIISPYCALLESVPWIDVLQYLPVYINFFLWPNSEG